MKTAYIFYSIEGHQGENWFPWLKEELEKKEYTVIIPHLPHSDNPLFIEWAEEMNNYPIDEETIFIGHSLGAPFILALLEQHKVRAAYLVSGFISTLDNKYGKKMISFTERSFDWDAIKRNCKFFRVIHSDNDPYVPLERAEEVAKKLHTQVYIIPGAGHFNTEAGFTEFPQLLELIQN
jgi:uncharacterized protein